MSTYSNRLQPAVQNLLQRVVRFFHPSSSCPTHISADVCGGRKSFVKQWRGRIYGVVRFFHPGSSCMTTHISADVRRIALNASCMTIAAERTEQLDIFCRVTGFASDFLSFIDMELIRFFHGALHLFLQLQLYPWLLCWIDSGIHILCFIVVSIQPEAAYDPASS